MARILITTYPLTGHVAPAIPIVEKMIENGHEVLWIAGRMFQKKVEALGAHYHPMPHSIDVGDDNVYDFYPDLKKLRGMAQSNFYVKHIFLDSIFPMVTAIDEVLKYFPADLLIGDSTSPGIFFKSEMSGIPSVMISPIPFGILSKDTAPHGLGMTPGKTHISKLRNRVLNFGIHKFLLRDVNKYANQIRKSFGLKPFHRSVFREYFETPSLKLILQLSSPAFEYPRRDLPSTFKFVGPSMPKATPGHKLPDWWQDLNGSRPVVLINQGTVANNLNDVVIPAISGLKHKDVLIVAVPVKEGDLKEVPQNVRAEKFIPFDSLMKHVNVMITNGGYGATQMALAHGIPLVIAGATEDKMEVAARVEWTGCGINLRKKRPSPKDFLGAVEEVLHNKSILSNTKRIQAEITKYNVPEKAVGLIESVVNG